MINTPNASHVVRCSIGLSEPIEMLVDSGSDWNVVTQEDWRRLRNGKREGRVTLYKIQENPGEAANAFGTVSPVVAQRVFHAWVDVVGARKPKNFAKFRVVGSGERSILGRETAIRMELLQVGVSVKTNPVAASTVNLISATVTAQADINAVETSMDASEFPAIPNFVLDFDIDVSVAPTVRAFVSIPEAYRKKAAERLHDMERKGIIERVKEAPRWMSGLSAVPKGPDDFRLVVNMVGPNRAIRRRFYKMPTIESIKARLCGAKYFTKLDLSSAFHHIRIGEKSKELTTFLGPDGMYRFRRLNFGVTSAPEAFQQKMEEVLEHLPFVVIYIDDILIFAEGIEVLEQRTVRVLELLRKSNLTLNPSKCEFNKQQVEFLGHELSSDGFNISKYKVADIKKFRRPANITELKSFLGVASFQASYIKNFADISAPLWEATKEGQFEWTRERDIAFAAVKKAIIDCTMKQGFFSETDETILYTDASPVAVGAVLTQRNKEGQHRVVAFASRLLSPTERRYPQTQLEALGIVWGAEHFWYFLLGRSFILRTDALGISFIMKRDLTQTKRIMSRADAWALRMEAFDFKVEFVKGTENIADPSSRLVEGVGEENFEDGPVRGEIMSITLDPPGDVEFPRGRVTIEEIKWHFERDAILRAVVKALETGDWPRALGAYKSAKHELRVKNGILTRMGETVVPELLRPKVLSAAHTGHPGMTAMKSLLRGVVWWPGMLAHVENWVRECKPCTLMSRKDQPVPMLRSRLPGAVWEKIAVDYNGPYVAFNGVNILLIVDLYSRYLIARPVPSTNYGAARATFGDVFDTFGAVKTLKSDGGPPFNGAEFAEYMKEMGITHEFSTPWDAQQNGGVETYMRLVNKGMTTPSLNGENWKTSLANTIAAHNAAVCTATGVSPDSMMFGRRLRRNLPMLSTEAPEWTDREVRGRDEAIKHKLGDIVDKKRSAQKSKIEVGDKVVVSRQTKRKGQSTFDPTEFTVIQKNHGTLHLLSPNNNVITRTSTFVKKIPRNGTELSIEKTWEEEGSSSKPAAPVLENTEEEVGAQEPLAQRPPMRRSERVRKSPAKLRDYVHILGWGSED